MCICNHFLIDSYYTCDSTPSKSDDDDDAEASLSHGTACVRPRGGGGGASRDLVYVCAKRVS